MLCKCGELSAPIFADIDQLLYACCPEEVKKLLRRLACESDGRDVEFHGELPGFEDSGVNSEGTLFSLRHVCLFERGLAIGRKQ